MKFRHEYKHYVTEYELAGLRDRLKTVMKKDSHTDENGEYTIKSLYFDNCYDKALREKSIGIPCREKFRIRYYNNDTDFIRLEKKSKIRGLCLKQSAFMTREQVEKIINNDIDWMQYSDEELIVELYAKMRYQMMKPKVIVVYDREAYVMHVGHVRVTIDKNIRGSEVIQNFFDPDSTTLRLFSPSILEVKWDEFLPQMVRDIVQLENVRTTGFSKYAATRFSQF